MTDACIEAGLGMPKFGQDGNFRATIWRRNVGQNVLRTDIDRQGLTKKSSSKSQSIHTDYFNNPFLMKRLCPRNSQRAVEMLTAARSFETDIFKSLNRNDKNKDNSNTQSSVR